MFRALVDFVTVDLSAFYLDVTKDRLYCDERGGARRRATQTVMYATARALATLAAPILAFTAEDVWAYLPRAAGDADSVHLALLPEGRLLDAESADARRWAVLADYRTRAQAVIEPFRAAKNHPLAAAVSVRPRAADRAVLAAYAADLPDLFGVSVVKLEADVTGDAEPTITVASAAGKKCPRCWKWHEDAGDLDARCAAVVAGLAKKAS